MSFLILLFIGLCFHMVPNIIMKIIKRSHRGHKWLTSTFSAGLILGSTGRKINPLLKIFMKYYIGPESLIEYELGLRIGKDLYPLEEDVRELYIKEFKENIKSNFNEHSQEELKEISNVPFVGTILLFANDDLSTDLENFIIKTSKVESSSNRFAICTFIITTIALSWVEIHLLFQPLISFMRDKIGTSTFGKNYMSKKFKTGLKGEGGNKIYRGLNDLIISPSALDTMRLGTYLGTTEISKTLLFLLKEK